MRASVCVGNYAKTPYCIVGLGIPVYSMEELCYCIKENAFLLDASLMDDTLLDWMDRECGLRELARALHPLVHKRGSLSDFVRMIMKYTGFFSSQIMEDVDRVLKQGAGLSNIEKRKSQIDYLVKKKKYVAALRGYDYLLTKWQEGNGNAEEVLPAAEVKAAILHNKGVAYTGLMLYRQAAEAFWEAYEQDEKTEYKLAYLAAKRMELSEEEYIAFAAERPESYNETLTLEKKLDGLKEVWQKQEDYQYLLQRDMWREGNDKQKYYDENDRITQALKVGYRSSVQE